MDTKNLKKVRPGDTFDYLGQQYKALVNEKGRIIGISLTGKCRLTLPYEEEGFSEEEPSRQLEIEHISPYGSKKPDPKEVSLIRGKIRLRRQVIEIGENLTPEEWSRVDLMLRMAGYNLTDKKGTTHWRYELKDKDPG